MARIPSCALLLLVALTPAAGALTAQVEGVPTTPLEPGGAPGEVALRLEAACTAVVARVDPLDAAQPSVPVHLSASADDGAQVSGPDTAAFDAAACLDDPSGSVSTSAAFLVAVAEDARAFQPLEVRLESSMEDHPMDPDAEATARFLVEPDAVLGFEAVPGEDRVVVDGEEEITLTLRAEGNAPLRFRVNPPEYLVGRAKEPVVVEPGAEETLTWRFEAPDGEWGRITATIQVEANAVRGDADVGEIQRQDVEVVLEQQETAGSEGASAPPVALLLVLLAVLAVRRFR